MVHLMARGGGGGGGGVKKHTHYSDISEHQGISIYLPFDCLFQSLFRLTSKETPKLHITDTLRRESTGDRWIPLTEGQ